MRRRVLGWLALHDRARAWALLAPGTPAEDGGRPERRPKAPRADANDSTKLDDMMEKTR